jgi:ribosome-binding protein aMBF1 (putative translation factor)
VQSLDTAERFGRLARARRRALGLRQHALVLATRVGERFIVDLEAGKPTCQLGGAPGVARVLGIRLVADSGGDLVGAPAGEGYTLPEFPEHTMGTGVGGR